MAEKPTTEVSLSWNGGLSFTARDAYGHIVTVAAPAQEGEDFDGMKPGELLLTSLAGCSGIDVANILRKQRQDVTGLEIRVSGGQLPDPPRTWVDIHLEYTVRGRNLSARAVERAIDLSENKYCSVGATLSGRANISSSYHIVEEP